MRLAIALMIFSEMKTLQHILDDQDKMLKRIQDDSSKYNAIVNSRNEIIKRIENARDILAKSKAFTHYADDIDATMKARYPEWQSRMTIAEAARRINERNAKWRASVKDYLKSLNANTSNYANDKAALDSLMAILKEPAGQTQALQAMGGLLDHITLMLDRDQQALEALITTYVENKLDLRDERNDLDQAVHEAGTQIKVYRYNQKAKKCKIGF